MLRRASPLWTEQLIEALCFTQHTGVAVRLMKQYEKRFRERFDPRLLTLYIRAVNADAAEHRGQVSPMARKAINKCKEWFHFEPNASIYMEMMDGYRNLIQRAKQQEDNSKVKRLKGSLKSLVKRWSQTQSPVAATSYMCFLLK